MLNGRNVVTVFVIWLGLTVLGVFGAYHADIYPIAGNHLASQVDDAFRLLMMLAVPVFTFVVTILVYSMVRFRRKTDGDDTPRHTFHSHGGVIWGWLVVTSGLTIAVLIHPGFTGLRELTADRHQDMVVEALAAQWSWNFTFPEDGVKLDKANDLMLPQDTRIRFDVTSRDVVHSLWLPMYRMKIDAVPGRTNHIYLTTGEPISFSEDPNVRVQCAELCGTGHPRMQVRVSIVDQQEFDIWLGDLEPVIEGNE